MQRFALALMLLQTWGGVSPAPQSHIPDSSSLNTAVANYLASQAPTFEIPLSNALLNAGVLDLEKAGIIFRTSTFNYGCRRSASFTLTDEGQRVSTQRGWELSGNRLVIPLGTLILKNYAAHIAENGQTVFVTMDFTFQGNSNASYLLTLGNATDWRTSSIGLVDLGHTISQTAVVLPGPPLQIGHPGRIPVTVTC